MIYHPPSIKSKTHSQNLHSHYQLNKRYHGRLESTQHLKLGLRASPSFSINYVVHKNKGFGLDDLLKSLASKHKII